MSTVLTMTTGMDLKIERIREKVTARAIARTMGVSPQRVAQIEATQFVTDDLADRYRTALRRQLTIRAEISTAARAVVA